MIMYNYCPRNDHPSAQGTLAQGTWQQDRTNTVLDWLRGAAWSCPPIKWECKIANPVTFEISYTPKSLKQNMSFCWRRIWLLAFCYLFHISSLFSSTSAILHIHAFLKAMEINVMKIDLHCIHHKNTIQRQLTSGEWDTHKWIWITFEDGGVKKVSCRTI